MFHRTVLRLHKQRIAVFGATMDPPTAGHMLCIGELINGKHADKVLVVPCGDREDKLTMSRYHHRLELTELSVNGYFGKTDKIVIEDIERDQPKGFATYDLLKLLSTKYSDSKLSFIVGSDWLENSSSIVEWPSLEGKTGDKLIAEFDFTVVPRPGYPHPSSLPLPSDRFKVASDLIGAPLSSTYIRESIRNDTSIYGLVHPSVIKYIENHNLYSPLKC